MHRAIARLSDETFDLLIVGGGVTGACIARDAALRGLKVALIEKNDFASATSAHNSKLVHGGLRYLRNLEFGLVRESLRERRIWQRIAPHLVHPLPFLVPFFKAGLPARATLATGLSLYDLLSYDRARLDDPYQRLPGHAWLDRREAIAREPVLDTPEFVGAFLYFDAQMYAPERLALECLIDADANGAAVANYVEAETLLLRDGRVAGCAVRDRFTLAPFDVRATETLVAAGPWADLFLKRAAGKPASHKLKRSKGIHVIVPSRTREYALTMAAAGGHFFVLPWRGHTLLGTTDTAFAGKPDDVCVSERDIADFFSFINRHWPAARLRRDEVEHFYAGLRPLVDDGSKDTYGASRRAAIVDHGKDDGIAGLVSVIGGKWTTSRDLAQKVVDIVVEKTGARAANCSTATTRLPGGAIDRFLDFENAQRVAHPRIGGMAHLTHLYGARLPQLLDLGEDRAELLRAIGTTGDIAAQIVHAVRHEMAMTLADAVLRRTGIGQLGRPGSGVLDDASRIMAAEIGWDETRRLAEIEALEPAFRTRAD
ncbi:MAG: glycerol-3-phosphate dehydrogenase/oxidase [Alphaproteobacteria bacterium]|nr:glycerol-3-phosphate dehydrogenase/oxidase [Alphaproteobacteria bacterium]